jgi:transposase
LQEGWTPWHPATTNGCSTDLRLRVLGALDRGAAPRREAAGLFGVSFSTTKRWLKKGRERVAPAALLDGPQ